MRESGDLGQTGWTVSTLEHIEEQPHDMLVLPGDLSYADRWGQGVVMGGVLPLRTSLGRAHSSTCTLGVACPGMHIMNRA